MRSLLAAFALCCACAPTDKSAKSTENRPMTNTTTWPALDAKLLADAAATYNFRLGLPAPLAVTPDGAVLFRRTGARDFVADLYELDTRTGAVKKLIDVAALLGTGQENLSDAEKARRERSRTATRGIVDIDVSADGRWVMAALAGDVVMVDRNDGRVANIAVSGDMYDAHLSPDGTKIAFVRGGNLWLMPATGGTPKPLTKRPEGFEYGVADFAAMEELDRRRGWWWSPDSKQIAFQRTDNRPIDTLYVADARHPEKAPVPFKYPRSGRPNAIVDLGLVHVSGGEPRWLTWDLAKYPYVARVSWQKHGPLSLVVLSREQTDLALLAIENDKLRTLLEEHDDAWINVPRPHGGIGYAAGNPLWLADGSGFLWTREGERGWFIDKRERDGGNPKELAIGAVRELVGFSGVEPWTISNSDRGLRSFVTYGVTRMTPDDGVTTAGFENGAVVATTLLADGGRKTVAIRDGKTFELPSVAERPSLVPTTLLETVEIEGRTHHVAITRPRAFDQTKKYPVILKVYGGPHAQYVDGARDTYVMDQWYADAGFIVVRSDNRGTPHRGREWERAILKDLITVPLDDQVRALQAVGAAHPELDMGRVGVTGWSFGGYFAAMAVLQRPDVFHAAVAGAPVTDWALYDTAYTERYMRLPEHNPEGYKHGNVMTHASKLSRPLLLVHGITDDNVHFAHTLALVEELYVHHKRAEVITLSATHMVPDPKLSLAKEQTQIDFFRQHLK
jgi:dipeptidyl-peptidase-4